MSRYALYLLRHPGTQAVGAVQRHLGSGFSVLSFSVLGVQCLLGVLGGSRFRVKGYWRITTWKVENDRDVKWKMR